MKTGLALAAAVVALGAASPAFGVSLTPLSFPDPVAEVPRTVSVGYDAGLGANLWVRYRRQDGRPCAPGPNPSADPVLGELQRNDLTGSGEVTAQVTIPAADEYLACLWLTEPGTGTTLFASSQTLSVRPANTTLSLSIPSTFTTGTPARVVASGEAETPRRLLVTYMPDRGEGCPSRVLRGFPALAGFVDLLVSGPFERAGDVAMYTPGSYLACGSLLDLSSGGARASTSAAFTVQDATPVPAAPAPSPPAPPAPTGGATQPTRAPTRPVGFAAVRLIGGRLRFVVSVPRAGQVIVGLSAPRGVTRTLLRRRPAGPGQVSGSWVRGPAPPGVYRLVLAFRPKGGGLVRRAREVRLR